MEIKKLKFKIEKYITNEEPINGSDIEIPPSNEEIMQKINEIIDVLSDLIKEK